MTKEEQFVNELIGYIFAYPDDDYMTMECLCRKLFKYGLIEKKDGEWTTDFIDRKTEPTISKMEQVDKDINVRSKDEPQTENLFTDKYGDVWEWRGDAWYCISGDEPQTETEIAKAIVHKMIDDAVIAEDAYPDLRQKMHDAVDEYEPQTDCAWK